MRLENEAKPGADLFILACKRPVNRWKQINPADIKAVIAQARNHIDMIAKANLVLHISREEFDIRHRLAVWRIEPYSRKNWIGKV